MLKLLTAPSIESHEVEFEAWLDERESIVFDPVSIPWNGLRIGQVAGRAAKHVGPGVAIDWFEIEGPINASWPPESNKKLFGDLPIKALQGDDQVVSPRRDAIRGLGGYLPNSTQTFPCMNAILRWNPFSQIMRSMMPETCWLVFFLEHFVAT